MCNLTNEQRRYVDDLKAAHSAGFCVMYRPSQGSCWFQILDPSWSNHPDCYMMEQEDRRKWEQYKRDRDCCPEQKPKPHPHAALIKAWADGAVIEFMIDGVWHPCSAPAWIETYQYRIKPEQSDLEKYGVEQGDVWSPPNCYPMPRYANTVGSVQHNRINTLGGSPMSIGNSDVLLFRRGVVNKL